MSDYREAVADRLERAADRMFNAGLLDEERSYRDVAAQVRGGLSLEETRAIEQRMLTGQMPRLSNRLTALAAQGEYDGGGSEGEGSTASATGEAAEEPVLTEVESGASQLLSTAPSTGLSNPFSSAQSGWISSTEPVNPYTAIAGAGGDDGSAYTNGQSVDSYSGTAPQGGNPNSYTTGQNVNPITGDQNPDAFSPSPIDSMLSSPYLFTPSGPNQSVDTSAPPASTDSALPPEVSFEGGMSTGPFTPTGPNQSVDTSAPPASTDSALPPEVSFEGGMSTGPFTPSDPNQSVDTSAPPASTDSALPPEVSFEGGMSTGPFTPSGPNQSVDTSSPPASPESAPPEVSFEGGMSTGPFTPSGPNQSVDTSPPPGVGPADVEDEDVATPPSQVPGANPPSSTGVPVLVDTGFDDIDQFLNQQAIDRAFNDAVFGQGNYDAAQQQLRDTITAINNLIPSDAYIIAGAEGKIGSSIELTVEGFAVAGLDRTTYDTYVGGAVAAGPGYGPVTLSGGYEWTTAGSSPIGIVNIGGEVGAGVWTTTQEYGGYIYVGEPFFIGLGLGWQR